MYVTLWFGDIENNNKIEIKIMVSFINGKYMVSLVRIK